ncbi:hypothetical protein HDV05_006490 [Chytridiales sp. JEL 0842]|nr:hypothetical protein HDV05_006490 [Chytridiales sp. JEL 0842]
MLEMTTADKVAAKLAALYTAETSDDCVTIADQLTEMLKAEGVRSLHDYGVMNSLYAAASDKKNGLAREAAMIGFDSIFRIVGPACVPYALHYVPIILDLMADKGQVVREAATFAINTFFSLPSPMAVSPILLPLLFTHGLPSAKKWQTRAGALTVLEKLAKRAPEQIGDALVMLIPAVTECINDTRPEVSEGGYQAMTAICNVVNNNDLLPKMPILVSCIAHPTEIVECIQKLSATTFVAEVTGPALAILVPILVRALKERSMAVQRSTCIIIDNLCKLVKNPADAGQFLPDLLPGLDQIIDIASFPEVRDLATNAKITLIKAGGGTKKVDERSSEYTIDGFRSKLESAIATEAGVFIDAYFRVAIEYLTQLGLEMVNTDRLVYSEWTELDVLSSVLAEFVTKDEVVKVTKSVLGVYQLLDKKRRQGDYVEEDDEGEEICNCDFSLAYGGMMLLNHTNLTLKRGRRYGLCGPNGAGKTTLMRSISLGKLDGFPSPDVLKTVMVEHSLQGEDASLPIIEFLAIDSKLVNVERNKIKSALNEVGFTDEMLESPVGSLSGGWKMKLELARAMLLNADILLLDEPTNHLDVTNVKWLEDYLNSQQHVTSIIVSHDSGFLDNVCTHIIHYERKKLVTYKGNLSHFVKLKPEAKSYYTLTDSQVKFVFPQPSLLTGIRSNTKAILYMKNVSFQYPGVQKKALTNVSGQVSLSSRVGIIGKNGAGKSTLIKVLLGETIPQEGTVWKHPNLRIGYVAQHAFHHLEQHLEKTPNEYIQWRYALGDDREVHAKATRVLTPEEEEQMKKPIVVDGQSRFVEYIIGRQKLKKSFQYEIKWLGKPHKWNTFFPREVLIEMGFGKLVQDFDDRSAARDGLGTRELTPAAIRKHLEDVGLDGDIATYNKISGLSGGQKVKVVIAAAMWQNPHVLILDEPTNYLDRDSLGGLAVAIRDWNGGVVMISHNSEFITALCPEIWEVEAGVLTNKGKVEISLDNFEDYAEEAKKIEAKIKPKKKKLTRNQQKERDIRRRERELKWLIEGGVRPPDTDSE